MIDQLVVFRGKIRSHRSKQAFTHQGRFFSRNRPAREQASGRERGEANERGINNAKARSMRRCKERLEVYLHEQQAPVTMEHHRLAYTAQAVAAVEHVPGKQVAKVVVVFADDRLVMLVLPASYRIDLMQVGAAIGAWSVYFAGEGELAATFPDCEVGAMPPFGNLYNLPVYVDRSLAEDETIMIQAGAHTDTIRDCVIDVCSLAGAAPAW
jgi:Ala-tRNA(Pro) deacylase